MELIDGGLEFFEEEGIVTIICNYLDFNNLQHKIESLNIVLKNLNFKDFLIQLKFLPMMQKMF